MSWNFVSYGSLSGRYVVGNITLLTSSQRMGRLKSIQYSYSALLVWADTDFWGVGLKKSTQIEVVDFNSKDGLIQVSCTLLHHNVWVDTFFWVWGFRKHILIFSSGYVVGNAQWMILSQGNGSSWICWTTRDNFSSALNTIDQYYSWWKVFKEEFQLDKTGYMWAFPLKPVI